MIRPLLVFSLLTLSVAASSQVVSRDSTRADSASISFVPTGIRIGTDIVSFVKDRRQSNFSGWEFNTDVDFHRYLLALEYGEAGRNFDEDSVTYANNGTYWRAGIDVNFLTRDPERNVFFLGMRYGRSKYSESMSVVADDPVWGPINKNYSNTAMKARWIELTTGLKVKVWKYVWLGYTARLKVGLKKDESREMLSHDVPGYGRTDKDTTWGFSYYLMFRIPFTKDTPILTGAKKK
jgi:hypothetical protein